MPLRKFLYTAPKLNTLHSWYLRSSDLRVQYYGKQPQLNTWHTHNHFMAIIQGNLRYFDTVGWAAGRASGL